MESDSESQDSDDGRRFRFEATRKDAETSIKVRRIDKSKHYEDTSHRDKRDKSKHESDRKELGSRKSNSRDRNEHEKDMRYTTKHSKHSSESRGSRREESKNIHGDAKRYRDRNRESHYKRSRERSYDRDRSHDEKSSDIKYRSKFRERNKHSRHQSRERSSQSSRTRSDVEKSRDDHRKQDYDRNSKHSKKNSNTKTTKDSPNRNVDNTDGENPTSLNTMDATSVIENRDYKDVDLSQFDVLSETDDNLSDTLDSQNSLSQSNNKSRNGVSRDQSENSIKISRANQHVDVQNLDKLHKVNPRDCSPLPGSSNNNPSAVSDFSVGSTSPTTTVPEMMIKYKKGGGSRYSEKDDDISTCSNQENDINCTNGTFRNRRDDDDSIETSSTMIEDDTEMNCDAYGPALPPQFPKQSDVESDSSENFSERTLNKTNNKMHSGNDDENDGSICKRFIGPSLPPKINVMGDESQDKSEFSYEEDHQDDEDEDSAFGPALPPHLLQSRQDDSNNSQSKTLGSTLPDNLQSIGDEEFVVRSESEDEDGIGPLPADHPAMQGSSIHEQLELRARRIKEEFREEGTYESSKREEWMMELPPAQSVSLGLGPRKFRTRAGPDMSDRSCWTDVPGKKSKHKKEDDKKYFVPKEISKAITKDDSKKSKKREKSLMEAHQEKLLKKKRKEEKEAKLTEKAVRRPFDRDVDLQVNRFDQAQKKSIILKAQLLNDRFSRGEI